MARIVGLGEVMIRLAPPNRQRIEQARSFDIEIGGAELNTLVGLTRLGHDTALVTRLPNTPLGHLVRNRIREYGVGVDHVKMVDDGRQGLCFFEFGAEPRPAEVHYDRAGSAMSRILPEEFDWKAITKENDWLHISGITPALSESALETTTLAFQTAWDVGCRRSLDLNYRSKLWSVEQAATAFESLIPLLDLLFATAGDAKQLFGIEDEQFATDLMRRFPMPGQGTHSFRVATTIRSEFGGQRGSIRGVLTSCVEGVEKSWTSPEFAFDTVDRIGSGDAFAAGIIDGFFGDDLNELDQTVETAAIMAALKHSIPGDLPILSRAEIEAVRKGRTTGVRR